MKKTVLMITLVSFWAAGNSQAQSYFTENFDGVTAPALPSSWGSNPGTEWKTGNPDVLVPRIVATYGKIGGKPYSSAVGINGGVKTADSAILSTPVISLPAGATTAALFFDYAYAGGKGESLTLIASTDGGATWEDVKVVTPNQQYFWETQKIDIGTYAGESNLKLGFRYTNKKAANFGVALDNIRIFMGADLALTATTTGSPDGDIRYAAVGSGTEITGSVLNRGTTTVTGYTVKYQQGTNAPVSYSATGSIAPLATATFTHATPYNVAAAAEYPLKVWVELTGDLDHTNDSADIQLRGAPFIPVKKLVFEEGTGAWCGWCPRGTKAMDDFAVTNPGKAAQIAIHTSNGPNGPDAMDYPAYISFMRKFMSGYPSIVVDRMITNDPGNTPALYDFYKENFGFATVTMGTPAVSGTSISVPVSVKPAVDIKDAKLVLVVTESNVSGEGSGWNQVNYYSGGRGGVLAGWNDQPDPVVGSKFHFVARSITPSPGGAASGLPATMTAGSTNDATLTATLDPNWKSENLQYIVVLIGADDQVLNSDFTPLPTLEEVLPDPTSVANIAAGIEKAVLYPNPARNNAYLYVNAKEVATATLTITDAVGRSVTSAVTANIKIGDNKLTIPTQLLANGMYLVNLTTQKGNISLKLQVIK